MFDKAFDNFLNDRITDYSEIWDNIGRRDVTKWKNLDNLAGIAISIASPEGLRDLSYGKVLIPETINYRTQKPERWGLFCEQIFGPRKNYECACGKYKRIRYKGITCERCGVEVTKATVRRERMAHIELYAPVAHTWFLKSVPSRIGLLLDTPVKKLEQVVYFASYIITDVFEEKREEALRNLDERFKTSKIETQESISREVNELRIRLENKEISEKEFTKLEAHAIASLDELNTEAEKIKELLSGLRVWEVIWELDFRIINDRFPHVFKAWTWAEHIKILLERIDLKQFILERQLELRRATATKRTKILQKIKVASNLLKSNQRPEWFILTVLPVIPPDLRPMIQIDGWRFASSDLNDLYRRVISRNNRLKKFIELWVPEVILKNEKRMLQESVDMLLTWESRTNKNGFVASNKRKLKSLTDVLKGKQGRFRQNLLGKRVDYSARSVIVVGPNLKMDECWIPKQMALTLFKPFVIGDLIEKGYVYNVKHAEKFIEDGGKEVWDALDEIIKGKFVLLNRAPTLHRLSIQAFKPVLIEGKSIQLHPLTCAAFNADFDGDQMAVHLPITEAAQKEARELMVTSKNLIAPSSWEPIVSPSQDMVLGCYYLTRISKFEDENTLPLFSGYNDLEVAYFNGLVTFHTPVKTRVNGEIIVTTYGRLIFNTIVPSELGFVNEVAWKNVLKRLLSRSFDELDQETTAKFADRIKDLGYKYATKSGLSISKEDMMTPPIKNELLAEGEEKVKYIQKNYWKGFMTNDEKYRQSISVWAKVKTHIEKEMKKEFGEDNHIYNLVDSGARWNWWQITQMCWMKGLVASPSGKTIELPIKSNLKEWFSPLEYFIATHGWRKGKSDTALKTAQSGYLTRRLVDAAQSILVKEEDCGTLHYKEVVRNDKLKWFEEKFEDKIFSRTLARDVINEDGEVILEAGHIIEKKSLVILNENNINSVKLRSVLTCEAEKWVCSKCYGLDLSTYKEVEIWNPIWIIAAQSIWEPGTQLTMRTFHSGWVASEGWDMTQGLARVEELLEARTPKVSADISSIDWTVSIKSDNDYTYVTITADGLEEEEFYYSEGFEPVVKEGQEIKSKQIIARNKKEKTKLNATNPWFVKKILDGIIIIKDREPRTKVIKLDVGRTILVNDGDRIWKGDKVTEGAVPLKELMEVSWVLKAEEYITEEIKSIYSSQGQTVNSKHIELIVRQMFSKVRVIDKWDSDLFPWDIVDIITFKKENEKLSNEEKSQAIWERLLLWLTKISLHTESWLSSASFQETVRVLVESSVSKRIDKLQELKENVIIWRKIPAGEQYRKMHGYAASTIEDFDNESDFEYFDADEFDNNDARFEVKEEDLTKDMHIIEDED